MFDSELPSDDPRGATGLGPVRADSRIVAHFAAVDGVTHVSRVFEAGSMRLRFPRGQSCEAVLLNTGGGITGGDRVAVDLSLGPGADVTATSQAAEKLYRSDGPPASINLRVELSDSARLAWLPQEAILFDGARVNRSLEIDMDASASLTLVEAVVFGRAAHGETLTSASWQDRWRIRRSGRLLLAENVRIEGAISESMTRAAIGGDARAVATMVHVAPDAEQRLAAVRDRLSETHALVACSAWNGMMVVRFAAVAVHRLRTEIAVAAEAVTGRAMPRAWSC